MTVLQSIQQFAATATIPAGSTGIPNAGVDENTIFTIALNTVYFVAGFICVIVIIIAAMMYTSSGGEPAQVSKAKNMILYAIIGLVVIIMAFAITWFVLGRVS